MKRFFGGFGIVIIAGILWLGAFHSQKIKDYYIASTTSLSSDVLRIHDSLALTDNGSLLFRASQPEILSAEAFNTACHQVSKELTIVLGCYTQQRFYVYDVDDPRLSGIQEVTAAHELLHAVYERLSEQERRTLGPLLEETATAIDDSRFQETIATYRRAEPGHLQNELYAILGTEIAVLPKELEDHYANYFTNRDKIVAYAAAYEGTFTEIEDQISAFDAELESYAAQKQTLEDSLTRQQTELDSTRQQMDQLRGAGRVVEYNALVPIFNQRVRSYNQDVATLQGIVVSYNKIVEKRNQLAMSQRELLQEMDSTYQPL